MTEEVTRKVSDKQERDNVDEVDNCLADDVLTLLSETSQKKEEKNLAQRGYNTGHFVWLVFTCWPTIYNPAFQSPFLILLQFIFCNKCKK